MRPTESAGPEEDWQWIEKFRQGDEDAFAALFNKHKVLVFNLALRLVRIRETAEDIAQEVFLKLYRKKIPFDRRGRFSTWLYRVTVNAALDHLKRTKQSIASMDQTRLAEDGNPRDLHETIADPQAWAAGKILNDMERSELVHREIDKLPTKLRLPILLYQFEKMS